MKKISLITIFDNPNFGTYLQALALGLVLQGRGYNVEILHYERQLWQKYSKKYKESRIYRFLCLMRAYALGWKSVTQRYECRRFVSRYVNISTPYFSYQELTGNPPIADIYLTGSDQVWNTTHNRGIDKVFYLGFVQGGEKKVAYAASIGMDIIPKEYQEETKRLLQKYSCISVREKSGVRLLEQLGINSTLVLDPTLLLSKGEWCKLIRRQIHKKPYVLVYSVESKGKDEIVGKIARKIADLKGYDVVEVNYSGYEKQIPYCDNHFFYSTPHTFLSLMSYASFVVVSSFHGTAFAINFNKPFITVSPDRFSNRVEDLLSMVGLTNRLIQGTGENIENLVNEPMDFYKANSVLEEERKKSFDFIDSQLLC